MNANATSTNSAVQSSNPGTPLTATQSRSQFTLKTFGGLVLIVLAGFTSVLPQQSTESLSDERSHGIQLYKEGNTKDAITVLSSLVKKANEDGEAWYYLGLARTQDRDLKNARKAFEIATKLRPDFGAAHTGFSYVLMLLDRTAQAGREATRALELNDKDAEAHYILGVVRLREKDNSAANHEADVAIGLKPLFAFAYLLKSQALLAAYGKQSAASSNEVDTIVARNPLERQLEARRNATSGPDLLRQAAEALETYLKQNPQDKSELWREQLGTLRAFSGNQSDIVPSNQLTTKVKVLNKPEPSYTEQAREAGVSGTIILRAVFSSDGKITHILILTSLPYGLTEKAVAAARRIKFIPATKDGKPVSMIMELQYNFSLY